MTGAAILVFPSFNVLAGAPRQLGQRLEQMQDAFFSKLQSFTIAQNEAFQRRLTDLQAQYDAKHKELEQQQQEKAKALADTKDEFDKQKKEFDDRESKHLRRQIREQLKKVIADRSSTFELTKGAQRRRWPVIIVYAFLQALFGSLAGYFIIRDTPGTGQIDYLLVGRQLFFSALFGITAGFFQRARRGDAYGGSISQSLFSP